MASDTLLVDVTADEASYGTGPAWDSKGEKCPKCGSRDLTRGWGFAFAPGLGSYTACGCGWFYKVTDSELEALEGGE